MPRFEVALEATGPTNSWIYMPFPLDARKVFGTGARVPVRGTLNGAPFRSSLSPMGGGAHCMIVSKELREAAGGVGAGDRVEVILERDEKPRTVTVPVPLRKALAKSKKAKGVFEKLSYTHKKEYCQWIAEAKKEETRARRVEKAIEMLVSGTKTPKP